MTSALPMDIIVEHCRDRKWQYPKPIENLDEWVVHNSDAFDPRVAHRVYWPDRPYPAGIDILIIDGGTTQAPVIAHTNPEANVIATVHSKASLDHAIYLKHKNQLGNLELRLAPVGQVAEFNERFDLVIASGVLQHAGYPGAQQSMTTLAQVLRPEGVAAVLVYSRHLPADPEKGYHPGPGQASEFLDGSDFPFTAENCLDLVESAGLVFQDWIVKSPYYLPCLAEQHNELTSAISKLPERRMWSVLEPLRNASGCHLFAACRSDRRPDAYRIDFASPRALDYLPEWRRDAGLVERHVVRPGGSMPLDPVYCALAEGIDGQRTIREIAGQRQSEGAAIDLLRMLWQMDYVTISLPV